MTRGRAVIAALLVGCSEAAAPVVDTSSSSDGPADGVPPETTESSSSESTEDSGADACAGPFAFGPPTAWPQYGLDAGNTRHNALERAIEPTTVACLQPRWELGGRLGVTSTPAVVGDTVYFGDWDGDVHARATTDGTPRWITDVGAQVDASPLVTADTVYVGDADGWLHAIDRTSGTLRWQLELDAHPDAAIFGSPILAGDRIVIGVASTELATAHDDYTFRGSVVALRPDGTELWRRYTTSDDGQAGAGVSVWSTAAWDATRGILYIGTGNTYEPPAAPLSDSVLALDVDSGAIVWSRQFTAGDVYTIVMPAPQGPDADIGAAPNLFAIGEREVLGVGDKAGVYAVLDRDDGATVWATQLTAGSHLGGVMTTAAVGDGTIWVTSNTWAGDGFDFGNPDNRASVFALAADDGAMRWQRPLPFPAFGATTWAGGVVYQPTIDGTLHALDADTGVELWNALPGGPSTNGIGGGVSVVDGTLYVGHGYFFFADATVRLGGLVAYGLPG